jgi:hypothetical protein
MRPGVGSLGRGADRSGDRPRGSQRPETARIHRVLDCIRNRNSALYFDYPLSLLSLATCYLGVGDYIP